MAVIKAVYFKSNVAPGLDDLPGLRQCAMISPLADRVSDDVDDFRVFQGRNIAQWGIEQQSPQGAAHIFTRSGFRKCGHDKKV